MAPPKMYSRPSGAAARPGLARAEGGPGEAAGRTTHCDVAGEKQNSWAGERPADLQGEAPGNIYTNISCSFPLYARYYAPFLYMTIRL